MSKFELELELTGFKVRIKGERGDIPVITRNVANQFAELLRPAANIAEGTMPAQIGARPALDVPTDSAPAKPRKRRTAASGSASAGSSREEVTFPFDAATWGTPLQTWKQAEKAIWLLYVSAQSGGPKDMSGSELTKVFNRDFRVAKPIQPFNVSRDLEKLKAGPEALVGRAANGNWFLTEVGNRRAVELVTEARTKAGN